MDPRFHGDDNAFQVMEQDNDILSKLNDIASASHSPMQYKDLTAAITAFVGLIAGSTKTDSKITLDSTLKNSTSLDYSVGNTPIDDLSNEELKKINETMQTINQNLKQNYKESNDKSIKSFATLTSEYNKDHGEPKTKFKAFCNKVVEVFAGIGAGIAATLAIAVAGEAASVAVIAEGIFTRRPKEILLGAVTTVASPIAAPFIGAAIGIKASQHFKEENKQKRDLKKFGRANNNPLTV